MKAVIVVPVFTTGGAENMAAQLAVNLDRSQVEVEVISMYPRQGHIYEKKVEDAGVPIHYLDKQGHASLGAMVRLWKLLSELKPDVVHTHIYAGFYTIPWVLAHRAVQLHTVHNHPQTEFPYLLRQFMWLCSKTGKLKYATISKMNQQLCCEYYHASPERFPYVNNPVETERFYHREEPTGEIRFISVGRLEPRKNQILAIRAMPEVLRQVPNAKLVLLGDGEDRAMLEGEADTLGVRDAVVFAGNQPKPEDYLAEADVYLITSHMEGLPLSVLEGMAAGLPVIATDVGGMADIVKDNGVLIADDDLQALTREMIRFAGNPAAREQCGNASRELVKAYDARACARAYLNIYRNIARKGRGAQ